MLKMIVALTLVIIFLWYRCAGLGETHFHVMLSSGLSSVGSSYKAVSVKEKGKKTECNTWLTARKEGIREILDGHRILSDINDEVHLIFKVVKTLSFC